MSFKNFGKIFVICALANLVGAVAWAVDCAGISNSASNGAGDVVAPAPVNGGNGAAAIGGTACPQGQHANAQGACVNN